MRLSGFKQKISEYMLDTSLFRKLYIMVLSFEMLAFFDIIALSFKSLILCWGVFILIYKYFKDRSFFEPRHHKILLVFLTLMLATACVHVSVWFVPNLAIIYYTALCFFVFYGMYRSTPHEQAEKEMTFILKFWVIFGTICAFLSVICLVFKSETPILGYYLGIYCDRLIGIYTNSNILAFSMVQTIVACDMLADHYVAAKPYAFKARRIVLAACVAICCGCLFLSDSNASFLFLVIYSSIRVFCNLFFKDHEMKGFKFFKSVLIVMGFCIVVMSASFAGRDFCQHIMSDVVNGVHKQEQMFKHHHSHIFSNEKIEIEPTQQDETYVATPIEVVQNFNEPENFHIGREHYEVSSGRIMLFKQGLQIFKHHPLMGIGRANLRLYSKKYLKGGLIHPDLHNAYLTILVSNGIIGFAVFVIFGCSVAIDICRHLFRCVGKNYFGLFAKLFSALVAYCGYCVFEKAILYDMTFMVGFFWLMLGYAMSYVNAKNNS